MPQHYSYLSQCAGKRGYSKYKKAATAAQNMADKYGVSFVVYTCPHCGEFHIGNQIGTVIDERRSTVKAERLDRENQNNERIL